MPVDDSLKARGFAGAAVAACADDIGSSVPLKELSPGDSL